MPPRQPRFPQRGALATHLVSEQEDLKLPRHVRNDHAQRSVRLDDVNALDVDFAEFRARILGGKAREHGNRKSQRHNRGLDNKKSRIRNEVHSTSPVRGLRRIIGSSHFCASRFCVPFKRGRRVRHCEIAQTTSGSADRRERSCVRRIPAPGGARRAMRGACGRVPRGTCRAGR